MATSKTIRDMLRPTPYTIESDLASEAKFNRVMEASADLSARAKRVGIQVAEQAAEVFESFGVSLRSEMVAESNQMEHLEWTPSAVREIVIQNRDLLSRDAHSFLEGIRGDEHSYEALGLYKAQMIADDWAQQCIRPREHEIRELHAIITSGESFAGQYKAGFNKIAGAEHVPPAPADAAEGMRALAEWLAEGTGDPSLDATIVHAWLAHLHPFDDGNGRMARLLANLALAQGGYPPLIVSAASDRGEYYDALAASDNGDILPLFDLFGRVLRRTVRLMSAPDYVENVIQDRLLVTESQQRQMWQDLAERFAESLRSRLRDEGWTCRFQGYPTASSFHSLASRSADGNSWFIKADDSDDCPVWLLWFGFNSDEYVDVYGEASGYPSVFFSIRADDPESIHPYVPVKGMGDAGDVSELVLSPGRAKPARLQEGWKWTDYSLADAVEKVAKTILK